MPDGAEAGIDQVKRLPTALAIGRKNTQFDGAAALMLPARHTKFIAHGLKGSLHGGALLRSEFACCAVEPLAFPCHGLSSSRASFFLCPSSFRMEWGECATLQSRFA
jgi:hypothetical protein